MIIVLVTVSIITYSTVANLLQDNAEEEMTHTVTESLGRFESIYEQIYWYLNRLLQVTEFRISY